MRPGEVVLANRKIYQRVQVSESVLEGLLRTHGEALFPDYRYFDFKPAIPSRYGTRHPDGALLSHHSDRWWVVEVETHRHDVEAHVMPQLEGLSAGVYGRGAFRYLERNEGFRLTDFNVNVWEPEFLLIVDLATPYMASAAAANSFALLECAVFRTEAAEYALRAAGVRPTTLSAQARGIDVEMYELSGLAVLAPLGGRPLGGASKRTVAIGDVELEAYLADDGCSLVLPTTRDHVAGLLGEAATYRLTLTNILIAVED